ncbi:sugar phosphate isomerase/epimerase family protein [Candidatus Laterigemmans baculatus]|uniref:sugar phosphate isomerase/epimerase family protein n=1 Tax=Candidatus Laterigemmans baculatus TaxID=2770505 RepID=UPI0013DD26D1|nr:sugar phosphate isomerase/epimerase family protein [Candidatus Laterigemmans baculatus]
MRRRQFLLSSALAAAAVHCPRPLLALPPDHRYMQRLGLQLYTVRNELAADRDATLKKIAEIGYKQVELVETVGAQEVAKAAKDQGLAVTSAFFDWKAVVAPDTPGAAKIEEVIEAAQQIGLKYLVFGYIGPGHRDSADDYRRAADAANAVGERIHQAGMQLCYHNHAFEFEPLENDTMGFDLLVKGFDPKLIKFEIDVFWTAVGGWKPVEILKRLDGAVSQLHLKDVKPGAGTVFDESKVSETTFQEVGDGSIDFAELLQVAERIGVEQCHVEQDHSLSPLESIAQSYAFLRDLQL